MLASIEGLTLIEFLLHEGHSDVRPPKMCDFFCCFFAETVCREAVCVLLH